MIDFDLLSRSPVFKGIMPDHLKVIMQEIHYQVKNFGKNEMVVHSGMNAVACLLCWKEV